MIPEWVSYRTGLWIMEQRHHAGWNQDELGQKMGVHRNQISAWESGRLDGDRRAISLEEFVQLCDLLARDPARALLAILREPRATPKKPPAPDWTLLAELRRERDSEYDLRHELIPGGFR